MANPVNASIVEYFQTLEDPRIARTNSLSEKWSAW